MKISHRPFALLIASFAAAASVLIGAQTKVDVQRTVYFTATDQKGAPVTDLTETDVTIKEGGKDRQVLRVEPSSARLKIAIAVDELLSADAVVKQAVFAFIQTVRDSSDVALFLGVLRHLARSGSIRRRYISAHTTGFKAAVQSAEMLDLYDLVRGQGARIATESAASSTTAAT